MSENSQASTQEANLEQDVDKEYDILQVMKKPEDTNGVSPTHHRERGERKRNTRKVSQ